MPIFRVKSVKIYTDQKNLHGYTRGSRDKYEVWPCDHHNYHPAFNSTIFLSEISQYSMQLVEKIKKGERRQSTVSKEISLSKAKEDGKKKDSENEKN